MAFTGKLLYFILKNNFFEFDIKCIQQCSGTAIMDRIESDFLQSEIFKPWLWLRYINNIFFIWTEGKVTLTAFLNCLNNFHPNLKFTHGKSKCSVNFLDVSVDRKREMYLYFEPTDLHQFLHFNSAHPFHNGK